MKRKPVIFRFNMVEVALALVVLAIGLSSVMVLFPVGVKASQSSVAENSLGDIAERVAAYLQSKCTSSKMWDSKGVFKGEIDDSGTEIAGDIPTFNPEETDSDSPTSDKFDTSDSSQTDGMSGLFQYTSGNKNYYLYQQYSPVGSSGNDRAVDFEAIIRVGWDTETLAKQYYAKLGSATPANELGDYKRALPSDSEISAESPLVKGNLPAPTKLPAEENVGAKVLRKCCRALIIEISWPADVPWSNREKRIFRMEMFNENFVPYPQQTTP